ncbi:MAG: two-component sensor histidine kinase [Crocinitomix sp.]|jgi:two-component sensor histidine kinase
MKFFTPPTSEYTTYYKQGAFDLTWRYNMFMMLTYMLLILAGAVVGLNTFLVGILCWGTPLVSLFVMKQTRKYEAVAYAQVIMGTIITGIVLNLNFVPIHVVEVIFMMIASFYAFITLGRLAGVITLIIQFLWLVIFLFRDVEPLTNVPMIERVALFMALLVSLALFGFLIVEFLKLRRNAENKYVSINQDLTEVNHLVNMQYQEKTVMLKEIHHRVKNNLQVISSLLRLQSYEIEEEASRMHFQDAIYRVSAMALIHQKMYQNENLAQINLENYIDSLSQDLIRTHANHIEVKLEVFSDIHEIGNDTLVPLALILNELITNSLKHAFADRTEGFINVEIKRIDDTDFFDFTYRDGGEWKSTPKGNSFGLELIATLTEQLDGHVERRYDEGTKYEFKLRDLK